MKNIIILFLFFFSLKSFAQTFPITQWQGAPGTNNQTKGTQSALTGFTWTTDYADTLTANSVSYVKYTPGIVIRTGSIFWVRNNTANKWIQIGSVTAALNGTYIDGTTLKLGTNPLIETTSIPMGGFQLNFVGTRTTSILPTGNIQMGNAGRISSNGTDTIKFTQSASDVIGSNIAAGKYIFYTNGTSDLNNVYLYSTQGDFLTIHSPSQVNFEAPFITSTMQNTSWLMGAKAPLVFNGSGNGSTPDLIEIYNADTSNLNNNGGIAFTLNRTAFVKMKIARIAGIITDTAFHSPDGDLQFYTTKDSVMAENMRLKGSGQVQFLKYGAGSITGTPTYAAAFDASHNLIETALGGGGTLTAANNGLSVSGTTVQLGGSALTQYTSIALNGFPLTINHNGVFNSAQSDSNSIRLSNNTASTGTGDTLVSPQFMFSANGRKTLPAAGSQNVKFILDEYVNAGGAAPVGYFRLKSSVNGVAPSTILSISSAGIFQQNVNIQGTKFGISPLGGVLIGNGLASEISPALANVAIANSALLSNTTGSYNIAIGNNALLSNIIGSYNVAIGNAALSTSTTDFNTSVGYNALSSQNTGEQNAAFGYNALVVATTAIKNTAVGAGSMENTTTGGFNVAVGHDALLHNITGVGNIGIGWLSGALATAGTGNVSIGYDAGATMTSGDQNIFIGYTAGTHASQTTTPTNSIAIGYNSYTTASNQMVLGNSSLTQLILYGPTHNTPTGATMLVIDTTNNRIYHQAIPSGTGTVTSVGFTGGLISVATPTTTPAFTVAGTSGGIPYFSSSSTWASSAALASTSLVIGGGAGASPTTSANLTFSTGLGVGLAGSAAFAIGIGGSGYTSGGFGMVGVSISPAANSSPALMNAAGTIVEAGSGTHTFLASLNIDAPTVTAGAATVTNTASLRIASAPVATVTGGNYSLWVDAGTARLDDNVLIGQTADNGTQLQTTSFSAGYVAKTGTYTATATDHTITGDASGGNFQITLPTAVGVTGRIYVIKSISTGTVTVGTTSSQTIDGSTTKVLNTQYAGVTVQSTGSAWIIIGTF